MHYYAGNVHSLTVKQYLKTTLYIQMERKKGRYVQFKRKQKERQNEH